MLVLLEGLKKVVEQKIAGPKMRDKCFSDASLIYEENCLAEMGMKWERNGDPDPKKLILLIKLDVHRSMICDAC